MDKVLISAPELALVLLCAGLVILSAATFIDLFEQFYA